MTDRVACLIVEPTNNTPPPSIPTEQEKTHIHEIFGERLTRQMLSLTLWRESPISAQMGVPLKVLGRPDSNNGFTGYNFAVQLLFVGHDPASPRFAAHLPIPMRGSIYVAHVDQVDLNNDVCHFVIDYIRDFLAVGQNILAQAEGEGKELEKRSLARRLSKEALHAQFEEQRRLEIAARTSSWSRWQAIESPVLLKYSVVTPACGGCAALTSPTGGSLQKCGKCGLRYYCSRDCQVKDWTTHKKACNITV
ncbi:hypothetical protein TI39_contig4156g00007 [Zymoseptoria brevis]|uniref:MYND-type domain-containing protein n=1 Tax=Zymoseptoria brevis TaxID=1047168 RepID=A0A0F4GCT7_9PEZI|nr:hypothetical protein TI39_contig4156g00007 [Zymoseptoria brevis]